jgi:hypothetical protein
MRSEATNVVEGRGAMKWSPECAITAQSFTGECTIGTTGKIITGSVTLSPRGSTSRVIPRNYPIICCATSDKFIVNSQMVLPALWQNYLLTMTFYICHLVAQSSGADRKDAKRRVDEPRRDVARCYIWRSNQFSILFMKSS